MAGVWEYLHEFNFASVALRGGMKKEELLLQIQTMNGIVAVYSSSVE